jgi:hypothetical protein
MTPSHSVFYSHINALGAFSRGSMFRAYSHRNR